MNPSPAILNGRFAMFQEWQISAPGLTQTARPSRAGLKWKVR
jgi:hypothetical protein